MLKYYSATDVGLVRKHNEDSLLVTDKQLFLVADGMGGHAAGDIASRIFVTTVDAALQDGENIDTQDSLRNVFIRGNQAIYISRLVHPERKGMGTTATMLSIREKTAVWAHVGDSRLYRLRNGELKQITRDHSLVADLVENGSITEAEARKHPHKNMLMRAVGVEEFVQVDTGEFAIKDNDIFLLCSDGLTNMTSEEEIKQLLATDDGNKAAKLVQAALDGGGMDNVTAIVVEYHE